MQELDQDEEVIWQMLPLFCNFVIHFSVRREGARLVPQLLEAKERVRQSGSHYAITRVMQWLALAAVEAGQLHLAYEESLAALTLIEQLAGYALLKGYFGMVQANVLYQWNRLEEARNLLHTVVRDAATWQHLDLLGWGYAELLQIALTSGDWSAAEIAWQEMEQVVQREHYGTYPGWLPTMRAQYWLTQGHIKEASDWAAGVILPERSWEVASYDLFPVVIRVSFARQRWKEALELLDRFRGHLDRPTNIAITITYLSQSLVALHQTGQSEQARGIAERLLTLTEPEGYLRVYLDEGEPMRQALLALLTPRSQQHRSAPSTLASIAKILAAFEQEKQGASTSQGAASSSEPALLPAPQASPVSCMPDASLTPREQEVLRLLAAGASNQDIAQTLVIALSTVKKHVGSLLGKLGAASRTQAVARARALSLL